MTATVFPTHTSVSALEIAGHCLSFVLDPDRFRSPYPHSQGELTSINGLRIGPLWFSGTYGFFNSSPEVPTVLRQVEFHPVKDPAQTFSALCSAGSLDLRAAATLALSPSHSPSSESLFNRINARKPKLNILGPLLNGKQCFMNILSIFQASTELEEISIEYDTHGQSTPTSSSHRISLQSLKNMILVGTDAAQSMDYIEAPSLEQLSVYFSYTLGSIVIRHLILWINFPSIKALIVREKSSWDVDGIHMDDRFSSWSQRISKNGWQYTISESNPRSEYEDAKSDCRFYFATSRMISIGIMESSYFSKMPKFTGN
ncbi:hypothetical protein M422DRAFT_273801 [Sphaerobolus stellatus SS14]|uniref:Uncharacterized protein n=1 Tax=Sphaerobolus stellatus (strain SS14) TaxID=990650 RepID=A0A0C9T8B7_SPHS4|nr:hypothetical protein M422DRAFT_273801 [Sphaerobolus stellatus SS14]